MKTDFEKLKEEIKKANKFKVVDMNVGFGKKEYTVFRNYGGDWGSTRPVKHFKTEKGALKEILRKMSQ